MKQRGDKIIRSRFLFSLFITAIFSALSSSAFSFPVQTQGKMGEVTLKEVEPFVYFSLKQKGSFDSIDTVIAQLIETARSQNVFPAGPLLTLFHGDLNNIDPEQMEWEVGFPVTPQALVQAPLERKIWQFSPVVVCLHSGSYEKLGETVRKMLDWMEGNGYIQAGPLLQRLLSDDPTKITPENLQVEIWIPCKKG